MSGLGAWLWGTSQLDDAIDKATSELLPAGGEDIALNLEICDQIRSKSVPAKDAMRALKRRLNHKNPNVQLLALSLTDICIKNGGDLFLTEVASREFMDNLVSILKMPALNHSVKETILRLVQNWSIAFEAKPSLAYVTTVYKTLSGEGYKFPPKDLVVANSAMVDTQTAPEWIDSEVCLRCRTPFSFTNRRHHCRNCGQVFDQSCSSKSMALPHFGIPQEVRVCDGCYNKLTKKAEKADKAHKHSSSRSHKHKSARELADAELQRAIQLSLEEVNGTSGRSRPGYVPSQPSPAKWGFSEPPIVDRSTYPTQKAAVADDDDDPDLKAAIEASLREAAAPKASAPSVLETPRQEYSSYPGQDYSQSYQPQTTSPAALPKIPQYDLEPLEADAILTFNQTVEQVQSQGGRNLQSYPAVAELYDKANGLRPKLALSLDDAGRKEQMLTDMHEQLSQAVKLYDQILTQQISQPRWRAAPASAPYQPQQPAYQQPAQSSGYTQWAPQQPVTQSPPATYASPPPEQQYQQPAYQAPSQPPQMQYNQAPVSIVSAAPSAPPQSPPTQYQQPQYQAYAPASASSSSPYAVSAPPPPVSLPQSPPPQAQYQAPAAPPLQPSLARNGSVSYASGYTSPAPVPQQQQQPVQQYQAPPPPQQQHHYQVPPQHQQQPQYQAATSPPPAPAPVNLPHFPSAPTSAPQPTYGAYGHGSPIPERKEALLIDL